MPRQIIAGANAPSSPLYSQGVKAGPHVLVSRIVGIDPGTAAGSSNWNRVWVIVRTRTRAAAHGADEALRLIPYY